MAFTTQLEEIDEAKTADYATFVKQLLLLGSIPTDPQEVAELFYMDIEDVKIFIEMALEINLMRKLEMRSSGQEVYYIPLLISKIYQELGLKTEISKIIEEYEQI